MPSSVIIGSGGSGGGSGSNASVGLNGAVAPTSSTEIGFINGSGNEVGVSATNPLPITGTITASNPSVGLTGSTAPTSATEIGVIDISGKLQGASATNPVRIDPTGTTLQPVSGTITANQGTSPWIVAGGGIAGTAATGVVTVQGIAAMTPILVTSTFSSPQHVIVDSGTITAVTAITNALPAGTNVIGHVITDSGSTTAVTQATAANLNATVVGTKTNNNAAPGATNVGTLPAIANAAVQTWTEGDQVALSVDLNGGQRNIGGNIPEVTAAWTSANTIGTTLTLTPILGYGSILITLQGVGTLTGGTILFEGSDTAAGTNWYPITVFSPSAGTVFSSFATGSLTLTSLQANVSGYAAFRVRITVAITGSGTVNVGIQAGSAPAVTLVGIGNSVVTTARSNNVAAALADNQANTSFFASSSGINDPVSVGDWVYGGAFSGAADAARQGWSKKRVATVFKTVQATASGNTAVWTPGSGNKFRILKVMVQVTDNASLASGAVLTVSFQDSSTAMPIAFDIFVPTTAVTTTAGAAFTQELDLGDFGILSAAANNVFNVNLSAALATGNARIIAMGTEE